MKTFLEYLAEEKSLRERILPAIKHPEGHIRVAKKRTWEHRDVRYEHPEPDGTPMKGEAGFYDPKEKKYYSRQDMGGYDSTRMLTPTERDEKDALAGSMSSTDNMTDMQRMRKYGTFE